MTSHATHLWRLLSWGRTLARHGALRGIERDRNTPPPVRRLARLARFGAWVPREPRYAEAFQAIGPAAIKLGQSLATRPDLVGEEAANNLLTLQDALPPVPFASIRAEIESSFGRPLEELYASVDEQAVGAASIAQVHKAVTTDGRTVAVKVLRPGIRERFTRDIETYEWAAAHLEQLGGEASRLRPRLVIANLKRWTARELDLRREAASASELAEAMAAVPGYKIPAIDWDRTNGRVMTLEWIDGIKISDRAALIAAGHDLRDIAARLVNTFLRQAIADGFFHADMHQGNLFVDDNGVIVAVDFGIMGRLGIAERRFLAEILHGLITRDYHRAAAIHFEAGYVPPHHTVEEFAQAMRAIGEPIQGRTAEEISMADLLGQLFAYTEVFDMQTRPELILLQKSMVIVEGVARDLDPLLNVWVAAEPVAKEWIESNLSLLGRLKGAGRGAETIGDILMRTPGLLQRAEQTLLGFSEMAQSGLKLDDATLENLASRSRHNRITDAALWVTAVALVAIALKIYGVF